MLRYVLMSTNEKPRVYHLKVLAEMYQRIYGGDIIEVHLGAE
jgi:hypothetical protein